MSSTSSKEDVAAASSGEVGNVVKFDPFCSTAEASFWTKLAELKLNEVRLSEDRVSIRSTFGPSPPPPKPSSNNNNNKNCNVNFTPPSRMRLDHGSIGDNNKGNNHRNEVVSCNGSIVLLNTIENLKRVDKKKILMDDFHPLLLRCCTSNNNNNNSDEKNENEDLKILTGFHCLSYLDLKKHTALYWFLFPALSPKSPIRYYCEGGSSVSGGGGGGPELLQSVVGNDACQSLSRAVMDMRMKNTNDKLSCPPFFIAVNLNQTNNEMKKEEVKCLPLSYKNYHSLLSKEEKKQHVTFCFLDPSSMKGAIGWPMRNLAAYIALKLKLTDVPIRIVAYRPSVMRRITPEMEQAHHSSDMNTPPSSLSSQEQDHSLVLSIILPSTHWVTTSVVGWELNARSKPGPRLINLSSIFNHDQLAAQSVDLNLSLMKWRLLPNLNTHKLAHDTKCLLLGAGTLGCSVARTLLGWGVRNITFADNGRVAYSNPVRQNLFELSDCHGHTNDGKGKYKAVAASEALRRIFPGVNANAHVLSIPMPGHSFGTKEELQSANEDVKMLEQLVQDHDVVFLLTDTRESRWLPTVICAVYDKMLINAALGLDSWLVMRHGGAPPQTQGQQMQRQRLGCYFCNDVVAPENSTRERTLDQQCTVTRPGLAPIAAAMAVELMVTMVHHEDGHHADAPPNIPKNATTSTSTTTSVKTSPLGILPHQIRGFLSTYHLMMPTTPAFDCCTACSPKVVEEYKNFGFELVRRVSEDVGGEYLENLTGLTQFKQAADEVDWDMDEEGGGDGEDDW